MNLKLKVVLIIIYPVFANSLRVVHNQTAKFDFTYLFSNNLGEIIITLWCYLYGVISMIINKLAGDVKCLHSSNM